MYKINGLPSFVRVYGQDLAKAQALPQNASADGNSGPIEVNGINGSLEIVTRANTAISIADTKALTVTIQHSNDGSTWAVLGQPVAFTAASGSGAIVAGTEFANRFALPSTVKAYIKAVIATTDDAASGAIDIIPVYLPR